MPEAISPALLLKLFPNATRSTLAANADLDRPRTDTKLERHPRHEPLAAHRLQKKGQGRVHIRFVSVRKRLLDPDNLCEKFLLDCLRNCGAIDGDEPDKITLETTQRRAAKGEAEHTLIEVSYPRETASALRTSSAGHSAEAAMTRDR